MWAAIQLEMKSVLTFQLSGPAGWRRMGKLGGVGARGWQFLARLATTIKCEDRAKAKHASSCARAPLTGDCALPCAAWQAAAAAAVVRAAPASAGSPAW